MTVSHLAPISENSTSLLSIFKHPELQCLFFQTLCQRIGILLLLANMHGCSESIFFNYESF